ncbi:hypothetical protein SAMN04488118_10814 [Epibacterium ulvae]|uniref:Uncharacterized protein n=1 Tax=Epibacterium ulvae TaxID=1156985 RepID=A0A1G5R367_9RHOB|nr:hypothetical protein SAMN04488118_10814 [Epibacterium ulvae]
MRILISPYTGDDHLLWPVLEYGGHGTITTTANLSPNVLRDIEEGWSPPKVRSGPMMEVARRNGSVYPAGGQTQQGPDGNGYTPNELRKQNETTGTHSLHFTLRGSQPTSGKPSDERRQKI